jgi:acetylornithine deacetylase
MELISDREYIKQALTRMVGIDSRNPNLCPDGPGEEEIGSYLAELLTDLGLRVFSYPLAPNRVNVVGILPGKGGGCSLMLNGHMDTVGISGMEDPFSGKIQNGRLYGRGSQDMKGSLAAMLGAAKTLVDFGIELGGNLIIAAVADEEDQSLGTLDLIKHHSADAAVVTEPTDLELVIAHRGLAWYEIETFGRAAHGSRFQEGVDAISLMGRFLAQLDKLAQELPKRDPHPLVGPPSLHAALIQGGTDSCTYAASCKVNIDRRTIPGESEGQITQEFHQIIKELSEQDPNFQAEVRLLIKRAPLETSKKAEIIKVLTQTYKNQVGEEPILSGVGYWSDASLLAETGMDAVLLGPVGKGLHSTEEWVDLESVYTLSNILAETAVRYCN